MGTGPHYLRKEFLKTALAEGFKRDDVKIFNFEVNLASFGGENYFSDIYRVKVNYEFEEEDADGPEEVHLIIKSMKAEVDAGLGLRSKESDMYRKVIPNLESILGDDITFGPKLFKEVKRDYEVYVFQDLNALGYTLKNREVGLEERDCILTLKKIAKFHAASMVYAKHFPVVIEEIQEAMFEFGSKIVPSLHNHITGMITSAADEVATWDGYESIADRLYTFRDDFDDKTVQVLDRKKSSYNVINHGDLWVNNILFKDEEAIFIDFQISNYNSPGLDINYFLYTSVPLEILKSKRYEFCRIYFREFRETLEAVRFQDIPTWDDFVEEMRRTELSGAWVMLTIFPMLTLSKEDAAGSDIDAMRNDEIWMAKKKKMFTTKRVEETFKFALDRFVDKGIL